MRTCSPSAAPASRCADWRAGPLARVAVPAAHVGRRRAPALAPPASESRGVPGLAPRGVRHNPRAGRARERAHGGREARRPGQDVADARGVPRRPPRLRRGHEAAEQPARGHALRSLRPGLGARHSSRGARLHRSVGAARARERRGGRSLRVRGPLRHVGHGADALAKPRRALRRQGAGRARVLPRDGRPAGQ